MTAAWKRAQEVAEKVPSSFAWSFCVTDIRDDAVFNIYAPRDAWHALRVLFGLGQADFRYDDTTGGQSYEEYTSDGLSLSFITPEGSNEYGPDDPADRADADARTRDDSCAGRA